MRTGTEHTLYWGTLTRGISWNSYLVSGLFQNLFLMLFNKLVQCFFLISFRSLEIKDSDECQLMRCPSRGSKHVSSVISQEALQNKSRLLFICSVYRLMSITCASLVSTQKKEKRPREMDLKVSVIGSYFKKLSYTSYAARRLFARRLDPRAWLHGSAWFQQEPTQVSGIIIIISLIFSRKVLCN